MLDQMLGEMLDRLTTDVGAPANVGWNVGSFGRSLMVQNKAQSKVNNRS